MVWLTVELYWLFFSYIHDNPPYLELTGTFIFLTVPM